MKNELCSKIYYNEIMIYTLQYNKNSKRIGGYNILLHWNELFILIFLDRYNDFNQVIFS